MLILQIALGVGLGLVGAYLLIKHFRATFIILAALAVLAAVIFALFFAFSTVNLSWKKLWEIVLVIGAMACIGLIISIPISLYAVLIKRLPTLKLFIDGSGAYSGFKWLVLRLLVLPFIAVIIVLIPLSICYLGYMAISSIL